jgi:ribosomal protein S18 acetylase RimI-like enzyme
VPEVRRATPDDLPAAAETLAAAFAGDAWAGWVVDPDDRGARLRALYGLLLAELALPYGEVWVTPGGEAAASWTDSTRAPGPDALAAVAARAGAVAGARAARAAAADAVVAEHHPDDAHWYLGAVGVRPGRQGAGLGAAVLAPVLERCDRERRTAVLETASERSVAFHERLGFGVHAELDAPGGGPHLWIMRRPCQA